MASKKPLVGFVGQGFVGKATADNFEKRGFSVIRYALEEPYRGNKLKIKEADVVFVCVPTPTTTKGFLLHIVEEGISLARPGAIVVVKSTVLPGSTKQLQKKFPKITLLSNPEFLSEKTAQEDTDNPFANVVGMPVSDAKHKKAAQLVQSIIPAAPFKLICSSDEAEIYKYSHNISGYTQILTFNLMYDMAKHLGADWAPIQKAIEADPLICNRYSNPVHKSGRGAGGACFIKDFAAFSRHHHKLIGHQHASAFMRAAEKHNIALLTETNKDIELLTGVYGKAMKSSRKKSKTRAKR
ncbi:MAG: NAD(P)-binding domain-containing protein [Minisyncoccia bacterium]